MTKLKPVTSVSSAIAGEFLYSPYHNANVEVLSLSEDCMGIKRINTGGFSAPADSSFFSKFDPSKQTIHYSPVINGGGAVEECWRGIISLENIEGMS
jgi:hypothetical protein